MAGLVVAEVFVEVEVVVGWVFVVEEAPAVEAVFAVVVIHFAEEASAKLSAFPRNLQNYLFSFHLFEGN